MEKGFWKMTKKKMIWITSLIALVATVAYAAGFERIPKDELILGAGGTSSKIITMDVGLGTANPRIRANNSSPNLEFASDGTSFLPFGSGSGGGSGLNVLSNSDFELGVASDWSVTGGTLVDEEAGNVINGTKTASWDASATSQIFSSSQTAIPLRAQDDNCFASFWYNGGDANLTAQIVDSSLSSLAVKKLKVVTKPTEIILPFICPLSDTVALRVASTADAAIVYIDDAFVGTKDRIRRSLQISSVDTPNATISGGGITLNDGRILKTYDGAGTDSSDFGQQLTVDLSVILTSAPADSTTYSFCIDKDTLGASVTVTDTGEKIVGLQEANFKLLTDAPEDILTSRYVCLGFIRSASAGSVWSGNNAAFDDLPRNFGAPPPVAVNPIIYSKKQSVGSIGSVANAQGPLVDGDFPTPASVHFYSLAGDSTDSSGNTAINLTQVGSPTFTEVGMFGEENLFKGGDGKYLSSTDSHFLPGNTNFTLGVWVKFDDWSDGDQNILGSWNNSGASLDYLLYKDSSNNLKFGIGGAVRPGAVDASTFSGWHHISMSYALGGETRFYVDGGLVSIANAVNTAVNTLFVLGARDLAVSAVYSSGVFRDFFFTSDTLTQTQINAIYSKRFTNDQQIAGGHVLDSSSFPYTDLTGKVSFWNLTDTSDGSVNAKNLTNNGSMSFTGLDIFGQATTLTGVGTGTSFLSSPDGPYYDQIDSISFGGWVKIRDNSNPQGFFGKYDSASDNRSYVFFFDNVTASVRFRTTEDGTALAEDDLSHSMDYNTWYHLAGVVKNGEKILYVNGRVVSKSSVGPLFLSDQPFKIGNTNANNGIPINGEIQGVFFSTQSLTDEDIKKLASSRLDHGVLTAPEHQEWVGNFTREDSKIENEFGKGWVLDKKQSSVYIDPGLSSGDVIEMKMKDNGFSPTVVPVQKFNATYTSDPCVGAECSINHNLPGRPSNVDVWHEVNVGEWERQDPSTCQATVSTLVCLFTGITTIDGTHKLNVIASMSDLASAFEGDPVTAGAQTFSGAKTWNGLNTFSGGVAGSLSAIPAGQKGEYKEAVCSSATSTVSADTFIDVVGMSLTLEPGIWLIGYDVSLTIDVVSAGVLSVRANTVITDSSNVLVPKTTSYSSFAGDTSAADVPTFSPSRQTVVIIGSTTTYKVRIRNGAVNTTSVATVNASSITGALTNPDNSSNIWALRL